MDQLFRFAGLIVKSVCECEFAHPVWFVDSEKAYDNVHWHPVGDTVGIWGTRVVTESTVFCFLLHQTELCCNGY